jgi:rhodanese-related sulfurtransferase/glutaredoxin
MDVVVFATKSCPHRPYMEQWLREMGLDYRVAYVEEHPEDAARYGIQHSPSLVIDGVLVFAGMPTPSEFKERLDSFMATTSNELPPLDRIPPRDEKQQIPEPVPGALGLFRVDATWGTIQSMEVAEGVRTVGELEVIEHLRAGLQVIDARGRGPHERGSIPGSQCIPHPEVSERMEELDRDHPAVFFCNGPQCAQSPWAIAALLEAGYPADRILYYRGGLHDWITLGLPITRGTSEV